jgi:septal ring factor EnvC (AmiA/AmiB activator)
MLICRSLLAILVVAIIASTLPPIPAVHAQSESDRLREALRSATAQVRSLEDQRTALQAQIAEVTRSRDALKEQVNEARAQAKKAEAYYRTAVREFNERLEERNQTLEKWRDAYTEAATVARTKDAERAKLEGLSKSLQASVRACTIKNQELVKVGRELLGRYEGVTFGDMVIATEPLIGIRRAQIQNLLQDYGDKILNQKVEP